MEKEEILGKKIECFIGVILLIPPVLGVFAFIIRWLFYEGDLFGMESLSDNWSMSAFTDGTSGAGAMSAAPIYLGLMAIAGAYLIKNNIQYFFKKK